MTFADRRFDCKQTSRRRLITRAWKAAEQHSLPEPSSVRRPSIGPAAPPIWAMLLDGSIMPWFGLVQVHQRLGTDPACP